MELFFKVTYCDESRCTVSLFINNEPAGELNFKPNEYLLFATGQCIARDIISKNQPQLYTVTFDNHLYDRYLETLTLND